MCDLFMQGLAYIAYGIESVWMRAHIRHQNLMTYRELRASLGPDYPHQVWDVFDKIDKTTTREQLLWALNRVANTNHRGRDFAEVFPDVKRCPSMLSGQG